MGCEKPEKCVPESMRSDQVAQFPLAAHFPTELVQKACLAVIVLKTIVSSG